MWSALNFRSRWGTEKKPEIFVRILIIEFERVLCAMFGDFRTDRHTHTRTDARTHTHTHTHRYRHTPTDTDTHFFQNTFLEYGSDIESKSANKIEVDFLDDCNTSFSLIVARNRIWKEELFIFNGLESLCGHKATNSTELSYQILICFL